MGAGLARGGGGEAPDRGERSSRPHAALTCAARAIALLHLCFRGVATALADPATQLRARGKLRLATSRQTPSAVAFLSGKVHDWPRRSLCALP